MMANNPKQSTGPKAFDIFNPSRRQPQSSSRPILITNKPEQEDPMMIKKPTVTPTPPVSEAPSEPVTTSPEVPTEQTPEQDTTPNTTQSDTETASVSTDSEEVDTGVRINELSSANTSEVQGVPPVSTEEMTQSTSPEKTEQPTPDTTQPETGQPGKDASPDDLDDLTDNDLAWTSANIGSAATQAPIVSIHKKQSKKALKWVLGIVIGIVVIVVVADVVLDAGWWTPSFSVPHTHFIKT
jgi:hypothetical protein